MSVLAVLKKRRSIRKYQTKPVEGEKITEVLEAARLGPSANNQQPCYFIVIAQQEVRESLRGSLQGRLVCSSSSNNCWMR